MLDGSDEDEPAVLRRALSPIRPRDREEAPMESLVMLLVALYQIHRIS